MSKMSNVLDLVDQTFFLGERATGITSVVQCVWVYERAIDDEGLRRFHHHLQHGRLSRRIERSALPFGRHRWVSGGLSGLEVAAPRPREEFEAWLDEQANTPTDPEHGPGWHLAVLPFTEGGAGVSLVTSHCLADGGGLCLALAEAAWGRHDPVSWPAAGSRPRRQALREDARQTARDIPAMRRAVAAAARFAWRNQGNAGKAAPLAQPPASTAGADERLTLPTATIFLDADEWEARAHSLGGNSNTLVVGVAARLAQRVGRLTADGSLTVSMPINQRTDGDTRANAVTNVDVTVDPSPVTTDLRGIRAAIKQALIGHQQVPDARLALLPLAPLMPRWLVRRMVGVATGSNNVVSSNLGAVDPVLFRADGTDADHFAARGTNLGVTKAIMDRSGGILALISGRSRGRVFISVVAYQPGRSNSNDDLQRHLSGAASDFSLTATIGWPRPEPVGMAEAVAGQAQASDEKRT